MLTKYFYTVMPCLSHGRFSKLNDLYHLFVNINTHCSKFRSLCNVQDEKMFMTIYQFKPEYIVTKSVIKCV